MAKKAKKPSKAKVVKKLARPAQVKPTIKKEVAKPVIVVDGKLAKKTNSKDKIVVVKKTPVKPVVTKENQAKVKTQPIVKIIPKVPKPLTRPGGYIFTITKEDLGPDGKRQFLAGLPNDVVVGEGFTLMRSAEAMFLIDIIMPNGSKQAMPRAMGTIANADRLFKELVEMENSRGEEKQATNAKPSKIPDSVVLTGEVDVDALVKNLPTHLADQLKTVPLKNPVNVPHSGGPSGKIEHKPQPFVIPTQHIGGQDAPKIETDHAIALPEYAKSIEHNLYSSFTMRMRNEMNKAELDRVLGSCLKDYTYKVVDVENKGSYVNVSHGKNVVRVPADEGKFIILV